MTVCSLHLAVSACHLRCCTLWAHPPCRCSLSDAKLLWCRRSAAGYQASRFLVRRGLQGSRFRHHLPHPLFSLPRACHPPTLPRRSRVTLTRLDDTNYRMFSDRYDFGKRSQQLTSDPSGTSPTFQPCHGRRCGGDPATCEAVMLRLALAEGRVCILLAETLLCCGRLQLGCQEPQPRDACPPGSTQ